MPVKPTNCIDCNAEISGRAKRCRKCFSIHRRNHPEIGRSEYRRNWQLKKKYGLESGEFEALWMIFKGTCEICGKKMERPTKGRGQGLDVVAVDHDHETGEIRGLICNACNKGLGFFKDNVELLKKATEYLEIGGKVCRGEKL